MEHSKQLIINICNENKLNFINISDTINECKSYKNIKKKFNEKNTIYYCEKSDNNTTLYKLIIKIKKFKPDTISLILCNGNFFDIDCKNNCEKNYMQEKKLYILLTMITNKYIECKIYSINFDYTNYPKNTCMNCIESICDNCFYKIALKNKEYYANNKLNIIIDCPFCKTTNLKSRITLDELMSV